MTLRRSLVFACALAVAPTWVTAAPAPSCGQSGSSAAAAPAHEPTTGHDHAASPSAGQVTTHDHEAMTATSTASDLEHLLAQIDQATGDAKVSLMATLLKRLVAGRHALPPPAREPGGGGAGLHGSMCPMCAAHEARHAHADAEGHTEQTAAGARPAAPGCSMMSQKK